MISGFIKELLRAICCFSEAGKKVCATSRVKAGQRLLADPRGMEGRGALEAQGEGQESMVGGTGRFLGENECLLSENCFC